VHYYITIVAHNIFSRDTWANLTIDSGYKYSVLGEKIWCVDVVEGEGEFYIFVRFDTTDCVTILAHNIFCSVIWANLTIVSGHNYNI